ncbi:MAG: HNH endonuclease [Chloroflexi bacterium]|nr:HNH endonuclease [Chloroflexota bacterium]
MFEVGKVYRRRDLHEAYGGQQQGGISTPNRHPIILLITGETGGLYGYKDGWDEDGTFRYTGEGQLGDMQFVRGNAAIRDHGSNGKELHLFQQESRGLIQYRGQMACAGYDLVPDVPDREGSLRMAIVFRLISHPRDEVSALDEIDSPVDDHGQEVAPGWYWSAPLEEVRAAAMTAPTVGMAPVFARRNVYHRSKAVSVAVQRRADGRCEACGESAPFRTPDGRLYLEPHHTKRLSDGGPDNPKWVIAVCPICHRRAHYASDSMVFNESLKKILAKLES